MKSDKNGRFTKEEFNDERYEFQFCLPSLKNFIFIILLIFIFLPWTVIISRCKLLEKISQFFNDIMERIEDEESPKKNGIFYKNYYLIILICYFIFIKIQVS